MQTRGGSKAGTKRVSGRRFWSGNGVLFLTGALVFIHMAGCGFEPYLAGRLALNFQQSLLGGNDDIACGTFDSSPFIPDCPLGTVCFTQACDQHDICYSTCDTSKRECDQAFFEDMIRTCSLSIPVSSSEFAACRWTALIYWLAVDRLGLDAFNETRRGVCPPDGGDLPEILGACCFPGEPPLCGDLVSFVDCPAQAVFLNDLTCAQLDDFFGGCPVPPNDDCEDAQLVCFGDTADENLGRCEGDETEERGGGVCSLSRQDCTNGRACLPVQGRAYRCTATTDNRLASTDGPEGDASCFTSESSSFQHDVWYTYLAPCSGRMVIRMCDAITYDSMLAVYGSNQPDGTCTCPSDNTLLLGCNDDFCGFAATTSGVSVEHVEGGACYTIRVGSWAMTGSPEAAQRGVSEIDIGVFCDSDADTDGAENKGVDSVVRTAK
ncbi:MAG: hypothetical protein J5J06_17960 [Phycisphaerae bacterium]|nr:hypothetical protein [Phycisphaerae bacterium]